MKNMTLSDVRTFFEASMEEHQKQFQRQAEYVIWTGSSGARMFDREMKRVPLRMSLESLQKLNQVTPREVEVIQQMIDSDDDGNMAVAQAILEQKDKKHGSTL